MDAVKFYWAILRRSLRDTAWFWVPDPGGLAAKAVGLILGLLFHWWRFGIPAALEEWNVILSFSVFGIGGVVALSWLYSLLAAPFRMARERQGEWDSVRTGLESANRQMRDRVSMLEDKLKPKMELADWEVGKDRHQGSPQFFRVCVTSAGGETVRSVQAFLTKLEPAQRILLPLHLHFSHDQNRNLTKEDLSPGAPLWVYVAALYENGNLVVCSTVDGERNIRLPVLSEPYEMGIMVTADNSGYIERRFQVQVKADNRLLVVEVPLSADE